MTTGMVERAGLNDAEADALRVLANICIGTPDCHIRREDANAWFNYMSRLEKERSELRSALTASGELVHELRDALKSLSDMYAFPGESNTERFERVAERFYAETGVIAPGKDVSAGGWNGMTYEDRVKRFEDWYAEKAANARAAMEKANG